MKPGRLSRPAGSSPGKLRIIAGRLRGSRLDVADVPGLRPTADRVRETLFNWLAPHLPGARCLDLFAGSGALGFEAASRGAASVLMIERDARAVAALRATAQRLKVDIVQVHEGDALAWLDASATPRFDIVFVDPPFADGVIDQSLAMLATWLKPDAWVYVESGCDHVPAVPADWRLHREGRTREVRFALYTRSTIGRSTIGIKSSVTEAPATLAPDAEAQKST